MARPPPHLERFLAGHGLPSQVPQGQGDRLRPCPTLSRSMIAWTWTSSISMGCGSSGVPWSCQCVTVLLPYVVEDAAWPGSSSPPPPARTAPGTGRTPLPRPSCTAHTPGTAPFSRPGLNTHERSGEEPFRRSSEAQNPRSHTAPASLQRSRTHLNVRSDLGHTDIHQSPITNHQSPITNHAKNARRRVLPLDVKLLSPRAPSSDIAWRCRCDG